MEKNRLQVYNENVFHRYWAETCLQLYGITTNVYHKSDNLFETLNSIYELKGKSWYINHIFLIDIDSRSLFERVNYSEIIVSKISLESLIDFIQESNGIEDIDYKIELMPQFERIKYDVQINRFV